MASSSSPSETTTLKVPINQVAIVIADLTLSDVLVTEDDRDNLYIFHDFKQRTTLFSNKEDGLSGHLFLICSGRVKAAATPRTTRISGYSVVAQMYRDLCKQLGVLSRFSRDIDIDPMRMARDEDWRRLARKEPNEICNKKLKDLEKKQLDELTLLLNSTLKDFSHTRMNKQLRNDIDMEMYPSSTAEERDERRRVEQKEKEEQVKQLKAKKERAAAEKRLEQEKRRAAAEKKRLEQEKWRIEQEKRQLEQIEQAKKQLVEYKKKQAEQAKKQLVEYKKKQAELEEKRREQLMQQLNEARKRRNEEEELNKSTLYSAQNPFYNYASNIAQKQPQKKTTTQGPNDTSNVIHLDSSDDTHMDECFICGNGGGKSC